MPLLVSLDRGTSHVELGAHEAMSLSGDELRRIEDGRLLARHRHNRWISEDSLEPFVTLNIVGPLVAVPPNSATKLGPYQKLSTFDGVAYVDDRVFGFWDVEHKDWYIVDAGGHWQALIIRFHPTD